MSLEPSAKIHLPLIIVYFAYLLQVLGILFYSRIPIPTLASAAPTASRAGCLAGFVITLVAMPVGFLHKTWKIEIRRLGGPGLYLHGHLQDHEVEHVC